ncbi:hypothetical protein KDL01_10895 [Actinospica durhamensis]|uniref:Uncharacterized protein n=1 Tax=Actinospica durhamensis TaxID=1508375 RepID=A0A941IM55_9ACTN|nr:hypothetical protein [Actinospica durhamensis]MBR7833775.1 hypothetical protein [Actinospica durhamensis]
MQTKNDCAAYAQSVKSGGDGAQSPAGTLPADAHPVSLLECVQAEQDVAGEGEWQVVNTVRSTGSVDGFVNALRSAYVRPPQSSPTESIACTAIGYVQQWIVLVDGDGTAYRIAIPFWGVCPAPDPAVLKALAAVKTTIASTERIRQTLSAGAQSSGCDQQFAEVAFVYAQVNSSGTSAPFFSGTNSVKTFRVCFYKLAGAYDKIKPAGEFESAATISGGQAALVYDGLKSAPVAAGKNCAAPATEYATLFANADSGNWSVVELGGCRLAAPGSGPDRQAPSSVIQALLAAKK